VTIPRLLALLAVALAVGTLFASLDRSPPVALAVLTAAVLWLVAALIAGALIGLTALVAWGRPAPAVAAVAFLLAGAIVFPVRAEYVGERNGESADCIGYVPLAALADPTPVAFDWRCTNASMA
jgi:hypothetical protein